MPNITVLVTHISQVAQLDARQDFDKSLLAQSHCSLVCVCAAMEGMSSSWTGDRRFEPRRWLIIFFFLLSDKVYISLYPIHSDTECLDTASGSANKQGDGENCLHLISLVCILWNPMREHLEHRYDIHTTKSRRLQCMFYRVTFDQTSRHAT